MSLYMLPASKDFPQKKHKTYTMQQIILST